MKTDEQLPSVWGSKFSRRTLLKYAPVASAAFVAACQGSGSTSSSSPSLTKTKFPGVTLQCGCNPGTLGPLKQMAIDWGQLTGGTVNVAVIPFAERAIKFAGLLASQDGSIDLLYASAGFVSQFTDRIYLDLNGHLDTKPLLPAVLDALSAKGGLRAAPLSSDQEIFVYNKTMFKAAGADPENPPSTWKDLYALAPKLHQGDNYGMLLPWLAGFAQSYWVGIYNSFGKPMYNDDRTQIMFNNADGLSVFQTIKDGWNAGFFDPNVEADPGADQDTAILFAHGKGASQIGFAAYWAEAISGPDAQLPPGTVGAAVVPGIKAGTSGSENGYEGIGVNKFTQNPDAAISFVNYMTSVPAQKKMGMATGANFLPPIRSDVLNDPDVQKAFPISPVMAKQGTFQTSGWGTPYNTQPVFDAAIHKLYAGNGYTPEQAMSDVVAAIKALIIKYLTA
jgi:ABC-type glycerol-3-phosphate transport system substrate-binding protein